MARATIEPLDVVGALTQPRDRKHFQLRHHYRSASCLVGGVHIRVDSRHWKSVDRQHFTETQGIRIRTATAVPAKN